MSSNFQADVIIAGAGPSGLIVGCEAALGGAKVLILEKRNGPTWSRAGSIAPRVMEIFASRGIADKVLERAKTLHTRPYSEEGIWAGLQKIYYRELDSDYRWVLMFAQLETETILADHFRSLGGEIRLNSEVLDFEQDDDSVTVRYRDAGGDRAVRGRYLVGADGNRSAVREASGIARHGTAASRIAVNVDALVPNPYPDPLTVSNNQHGWAMTYPLRDGVTRFAFIDAATTGDPPKDELTLAEAKDMLRRVHGSDYDIQEVDAINRFHDALYVTDRLRDRRLFLVGESVRVHYPASGVGMNFCIQDGFNLGWKLAAAVAGRAPNWLLDTYESERFPEIMALLDDVRRQCAIQFNFDAEHIALKNFLERDVLPNPQLNLQICENLAGFSAAYPSPPDSPAIVGRRLPNLVARSNGGRSTSVFELLREQKFVLLSFDDNDITPSPDAGIHLVVGKAKPGDRALLQNIRAVLIRPDGHVAWAGTRPLSESLPVEEIRQWLNLAPSQRVFAERAAAHAD